MPLILDDPTFGILGGLEASTAETIVEDRGDSAALDWSQSGLDQDLELYGYAFRLHPAEQVPYDTVSGLAGGGGVFILDTSTLGNFLLNFVDLPIEDRGRSIQIDWSQAGFDQDLELYGYGIRFMPA